MTKGTPSTLGSTHLYTHGLDGGKTSVFYFLTITGSKIDLQRKPPLNHELGKRRSERNWTKRKTLPADGGAKGSGKGKKSNHYATAQKHQSVVAGSQICHHQTTFHYKTVNEYKILEKEERGTYL